MGTLKGVPIALCFKCKRTVATAFGFYMMSVGKREMVASVSQDRFDALVEYYRDIVMPAMQNNDIDQFIQSSVQH
jgi:hypothetical protein